VEGEKVSADEPGYVPPDHNTTADFQVPPMRRPADPPADDRDDAAETVMDQPVDFNTPPNGISEAPATITDTPIHELSDTPAEDGWSPLPSGDIDYSSLPSDDLPAEDDKVTPAMGNRLGSEAGQSGTSHDPGEHASSSEGPPGEPPAGAHFTPAGAQDGGQPGPGEWTAAFGSGETLARGESTAPHPGLSKPAGASAPPAEEHGRLQVGAVPPPLGSAPSGGHVPPPSGGGPGPQGGAAPSVEARHEHAPPGNEFPPPYGSPVGSPVPPGPQPGARQRNGARTRLIITAAVVLGVVLLGGGLAIVLLTGGEENPPRATQQTPSASASSNGAPPGVPNPTAGSPQPGRPPGSAVPQPTGPAAPPTAPIGPVLRGRDLTYQLVQQDPGYFEGLVIVTNRSSKPLKSWTLTFQTPKANVKNIWGAELVHGGDKVEIRSLEGAPPIPPGAAWEIRFGAEGSPVAPGNCMFNGQSCGLK
jgi:cellulose binding protein with CBM2 domain